ncbi:MULTISPECIES: DUF2065 family protein [Thioclava]|uniref:DUF2065 family protein n=1 Tax=Thioclava TaxID=285107 RepID=UPI0009D496D1|nr:MULTISPECIES: DUF2065 family protein [Thioclava]MAQ37621.1 hypothetical protein [Thioclava sp.]OOY10462.1 hypothetical protein BMI89_00685 [Thioclava sp. F36-7]|tara:strand:- start:191 stop:382 length:192 start_codon:yes stop_codon:yes gene_type:complete
MAMLLTGLGLVLVIEGLALALAPSRIEEALDMLRAMSAGQRRALGLAALAMGVAILWALRQFG